MKVKTKILKSAGSTDFIMFDDRETRSWMFLRLNPETRMMAGFFGDPSRRSLSRIRPLRVRVSDHVDLANDGAIRLFALSAYCRAGALRLKVARPAAPAPADPGLEWARMVQAAGHKAPSLTEGLESDIEISEAEAADMNELALAAREKDGIVQLNMRMPIEIGNPASGYDAIRFQGILARHDPAFALPEDFDVERARDALKLISSPSSRAVFWYGSGVGTEPEDRMQAARSFPMLAGYIADSITLSRVVDRRESLQAALIEMTGIGKGGLKRLQKVSVLSGSAPLFERREDVVGEDALGVNRARHTLISASVSLEASLRHLSDLPADRIPDTNEGWQAYQDVLSAVAIPISNALNLSVKDVLSGCNGDWVAFRETLARAADFDPDSFTRRTMALCVIDGIEAIEDFSRSVVLPQALASIEETEQPCPVIAREFLQIGRNAATALTLGKTRNVAGAILELSRRYASRIPALMDIILGGGEEQDPVLQQDYGDEEFPILTGDFHSSTGLVVRPFRNYEEMRQESARLNHCVGRLYLNNARTGKSHLYSVQSENGAESFSTIEIAGIPTDCSEEEAMAGIRVVQHRANRNANPDGASVLACDEFLGAVRRGRLKMNVTEIHAWRARLALEGSGNRDATAHVGNRAVTWGSVLEVNWSDPDMRQALWQEWSGIIGGDIGRAASPEVIYRNAEARNLVGQMSPAAASILVERSRRASQAAPEPAAGP